MNLAVVDLSGEPFARGRAFGLARREHIAAFTRDWLESLRDAGLSDPVAYVSRMLQETDFLTAIRAHVPDVLEEVRGIADGADQSLDVVLASQLMDEEWAYRPQFLRRGEAEQKCSSLAIRSGQGLTWLGQNMDLGRHTDGHQVVMRIASHGVEPGALVFTIGGMVGLLGVNARSIGVCVNSLPQLPYASEGLPVAFVIRKLLQARNMAEAVEVVSTVPHATGQHYLIAGPRWVRSFEASACGVVEYHSPDPARVLHTNHPLAQAADGMGSSPYLSNSLARLRSLNDRLMQGVPDLDAIKDALCASDDPEHPVCRLPAKDARRDCAAGPAGLTTGSLIAALEEQSAAVDNWISAGPPAVRGYERVSLLRA